MQPAQFRQADFLLVEINNAKFTRPAASSGEECGLLFWTTVGNQANMKYKLNLMLVYMLYLCVYAGKRNDLNFQVVWLRYKYL